MWNSKISTGIPQSSQGKRLRIWNKIPQGLFCIMLLWFYTHFLKCFVGEDHGDWTEKTGCGLFEADHAKQCLRSCELSSKVKQMLRSCKAIWHLPVFTQQVPMTDTWHCALSESQWLTLASVYTAPVPTPVFTQPVPMADTHQTWILNSKWNQQAFQKQKPWTKYFVSFTR